MNNFSIPVEVVAHFAGLLGKAAPGTGNQIIELHNARLANCNLGIFNPSASVTSGFLPDTNTNPVSPESTGGRRNSSPDEDRSDHRGSNEQPPPDGTSGHSQTPGVGAHLNVASQRAESPDEPLSKRAKLNVGRNVLPPGSPQSNASAADENLDAPSQRPLSPDQQPPSKRAKMNVDSNGFSVPSMIISNKEEVLAVASVHMEASRRRKKAFR